MPINVEGYNVPPVPLRESEGIIRLGETLAQNRRWSYQLQREREAEQWRKLNLIQDLTDLSKHQTGSDVADAVGNQHASEILQKYTQAADAMSPAELQANVQKDMSGVIGGMDALKNELTIGDEQLKVLKSQYPDLDTVSLAKDLRVDALHRRLDNNGKFQNPITVPQSSIDLGNEDFLSKYVTGDKNLRTYFQNPQGMDEMSVFKGTPNSYTKYTAKVPPYKKPNFEPNSLKAGFMTTKGEPELQFKSSTLPSDALPSSNSKPFEMMDKDVYDNITGKEKLELIAAARNKFSNYDQMNPTEKEYAQRHVLLNTAKAFDQTGFHPTEVHTPSAALLKFYAGDTGKGASGEINLNRIYEGIEKKVSDREKQGQSWLPVSILDPDEKEVIVGQAQKKDKDLTDDDLQIIRGDDGTLRVFDKKGDFVNYATKVASNYKHQPGIKENREVLKEGEAPKIAPTKNKKDPLGILD